MQKMKKRNREKIIENHQTKIPDRNTREKK